MKSESATHGDKCELCERVLPDKLSSEARGWDWFTGYLTETVHFCPDHANSPKHDALLRESRIKPEVPSEI